MEGSRWVEADRLFRQDPQWLGGDAAYSITLDDERTLWLFGDSFIATSPALTRRESTLVRNSVAVMSGRDPLTATMEHAWNRAAVSAFFPDDGAHWFWPMGGVRVPGASLVVFLTEVREEPSAAFGYAVVGTRAVRVRDPSGPAASWVIEPLVVPPAPHAADALLASCVAVDNGHVVGVAVDGDRGRLVRWPIVSLANGDLATRQWWTGKAWVDEAALAASPAVVFEDASTECSLMLDPRHTYTSVEHPEDARWVYVHSKGFGATDIAYRDAARVEGPYGGSFGAFRPPQSARTNAFVYAAKAHPLIAPNGSIAMTYVDNSFDFEMLVDPVLERDVYWPHFAKLDHFWAAE
jgi:hypothetical protein